MKEIKVGLIGLGTVGSGAAHLLLEHGDRLERTLGSPIRLVKVADTDWSSDRGLHLPKEMTTESAEEIINDPEIDIVVELIGGLDQAKDYILQSLEAGKQVVTANKALLAHHGNEIFAKADQAKLNVFYEAAVCGGIPIIRSIREGLPANRVQTLYGILNGTCNYILTRMSENDEPYAQALASAQSEGLAEADPTLDVTGMDPAHKLAILISLAFGGRLQFDELSVQGIESIEAGRRDLRRRVRLCGQVAGHRPTGGRSSRRPGSSGHAAQGAYAGRGQRRFQRRPPGRRSGRRLDVLRKGGRLQADFFRRGE